ncbi:MAG: hypothetical protein ACOYD4_02505 [Solirubrobacterales bacterium]
MATVDQFFCNPIWQSYGTTAWNVPGWGDRDTYWGFSARPHQARDTVSLDAVGCNSDNNLNQSTDLVVRIRNNQGPAGGGGEVRLTAIRVRLP